jgi:hypothetical protein
VASGTHDELIAAGGLYGEPIAAGDDGRAGGAVRLSFEETA